MIFRNYKKLLFVFLLFVTAFYSCKDVTRQKTETGSIQQVASFMNKSIEFASLFSDNIIALDIVLWAKRNKIVLYLDSMNCTSCAFNEIRKWNMYSKELERLKTDIVIICNYSDVKAVLDVKEAVHVEFPVFFDADRRFKSTNNIPQDSMFHIFVVGFTNKVIWIGLPIRSSKSWEDFCSMIILSNREYGVI